MGGFIFLHPVTYVCMCITASLDHLLKRHCGVLGLAALVEACPYSVPDWLPEVIDEVAQHLHDPMPIQVCVCSQLVYCSTTPY